MDDFIFDLRAPGDKQAVNEISLAAERANHEQEHEASSGKRRRQTSGSFS
jgi:hypothetical protein